MRLSLLFVTLAVCLFAGCPSQSPQPSPPQPTTPSDGIVWHEEGIEYVDYSISLGYRVSSCAGSRLLEPVTSIRHNGAASAGAMVFNQLLSVDGRELTEPEVATIYEVVTDEGRYSPPPIDVPEDAKQCVVRYRIVLPNSEQLWKSDVAIELK